MRTTRSERVARRSLDLLLANEDGTPIFAELPALPLESAQLTLSALSVVGTGSAAGAHALAELFDELGRSDLVEVSEDWINRRNK